MSLLEQIQHDVKDAMKAGERERVHALRLVVNELQKAAKEDGADEVEEREADLISGYLPEPIGDDELGAIVGDAVAESGATSAKEMGRVMALVMPQVKGRADGKRVSAAVKERLTA